MSFVFLHYLSTWVVEGGSQHQISGCSSFGARPRSEQWPSARRNQSAAKPQSPGQKPPQQIPQPGRWRQDRSKKSPDVVVEEAKKVSGIEAAYAALAALASVGTTNGPEVQVLQDVFGKARRAAQESPISVQIAQSESFVERSKKRLEAHEALLAELVAEMEAGQVRVTRMRAVAEQPVPPGDVDEIVILRAKLASAEEARDAALQARPVKVRDRMWHDRHPRSGSFTNSQDTHSSRFVLLDATVPPGIAGGSQISSAGTDVHVERHWSVDVGVHRHDRSVKCATRSRESRYVRVGEASHPGPSTDCQVVSSSDLAAGVILSSRGDQ